MQWLGESHTIAPNGYDNGRDGVVSAATRGTTTYKQKSYTSTVEYVTGLLTPGSEGMLIHGYGCPLHRLILFLGINHGISIDGRIAVLTVTTL